MSMGTLTKELLNRPEFLEKNFKQIVGIAGKGKLIDDSVCSKQVRELLRNVEASKIFDWVEDCLEDKKFDDSGFALQDLVNELGRRLEYEVENGLYRGVKDDTGQDGIWRVADEHIIVEVKSTAVYQIKLDTIINYKKKLVEKKRVNPDASILIIVGQADPSKTKDLEAQIRGSRHAWEIRIISAEALYKLVDLKLNTEAPETTEQIRNILRPVEYTRLDDLIDIVFTTSQDVDSETDEMEGTEDEQELVGSPDDGKNKHRVQQKSSATIIAAVRARAIKALSKREKVSLVASKRAQFVNSDGTIRTITRVSKIFSDGGKEKFWFAFPPHQLAFLKEAKRGFLLLAGIGQNLCHAIDTVALEPILPKLPGATKSNVKLWHFHVHKKSDNKFELYFPKHNNLDLEPYKIEMPPTATE